MITNSDTAHRVLDRITRITAGIRAYRRRLELLSVMGFHVSLPPRLTQFTHQGRIRASAPWPGRLRGDLKPAGKVGWGWAAISSLERAAGMDHIWRLG